MDQILSHALHSAVLLLEVLALVWAGKKIAERLTRTNFDRELMTIDNPASGIALSGFYLGLFVALSGLLAGEAHTLGEDALRTAGYGAATITALFLSASLWRPILHLDLRKDIHEARNLGAGLIGAAAFIGSGLVFRGALHGESAQWWAVGVFFLIGEGALFLAILLYEWITPYSILEEVTQKQNVAAAIGLSGAIVASGLIVGNAMEGDFTTWRASIRDSLLHLLPLLALPLVRSLVVNGLLLSFRNVNREVTEDRNPAVGLVEASAYIGIAVFVLHLL
jgi:uncharacterized membrane protein YjfL (UPF0719 family)